MHNLLSQNAGHFLQVANCIVCIQQKRPNLHRLANRCWKDKALKLIFALGLDELNIWELFSNEPFQMLAVVCLIYLYLIPLQNCQVCIIHLSHTQSHTHHQ